jgi:hypothetical protein
MLTAPAYSSFIKLMQVNLSRAKYYLEAFVLPDYNIREKYRLKHCMRLCKHSPITATLTLGECLPGHLARGIHSAYG